MRAAVSGAALFDADGNCVSGKHGASDDQLSATLTAGVYHGAILEAKPAFVFCGLSCATPIREPLRLTAPLRF